MGLKIFKKYFKSYGVEFAAIFVTGGVVGGVISILTFNQRNDILKALPSSQLNQQYYCSLHLTIFQALLGHLKLICLLATFVGLFVFTIKKIYCRRITRNFLAKYRQTFSDLLLLKKDYKAAKVRTYYLRDTLKDVRKTFGNYTVGYLEDCDKIFEFMEEVEINLPLAKDFHGGYFIIVDIFKREHIHFPSLIDECLRLFDDKIKDLDLSFETMAEESKGVFCSDRKFLLAALYNSFAALFSANPAPQQPLTLQWQGLAESLSFSLEARLGAPLKTFSSAKLTTVTKKVGSLTILQVTIPSFVSKKSHERSLNRLKERATSNVVALFNP